MTEENNDQQEADQNQEGVFPKWKRPWHELDIPPEERVGDIASIAVQMPNGDITSVVVRHSGKPEDMGWILYNHYQDRIKILRLVGLGHMLSIGKEIGEPYSRKKLTKPELEELASKQCCAIARDLIGSKPPYRSDSYRSRRDWAINHIKAHRYFYDGHRRGYWFYGKPYTILIAQQEPLDSQLGIKVHPRERMARERNIYNISQQKASVAIKFPNGKITSIYVQDYGFPLHQGKILLEHYQDRAKILRLIGLGSLCSIGKEVRGANDIIHAGEGDIDLDNIFKSRCFTIERDFPWKRTSEKSKDYESIFDWARENYDLHRYIYDGQEQGIWLYGSPLALNLELLQPLEQTIESIETFERETPLERKERRESERKARIQKQANQDKTKD